jgi:hypothetical protein
MRRSAPEPKPLGPWRRGVNTVTKETELKGDELRAAVNVDLTDRGGLRRRPGYTQAYSGSDIHSVWSNARRTLFVEGSSLKSLQPDYTAATLDTLSVGSAKMSYAEVAGDIYFSNGFDTGRLLSTLALRPMSLPNPGTPVVTQLTAGSLVPGTYLVATTFVAPDGVESGASNVRRVVVSAGQGIDITSVPQPPAGYTADVWVYVSKPDGERLYLASKVPQGTTTEIFPTQPKRGMELRTLTMTPLPAGGILRHHGGRLYTTIGSVLYWSDSMNFGLHRPDIAYQMFEGDITVVEPVRDGIYVVADQTYFLQGLVPEDFKRTVAYPYGAASGSGMQARGTWFGTREPLPAEVAYWFSDRGGVIGAPGGQVIPLMEGRTEDAAYAAGHSYFVERNGFRQVGTVLERRGPSAGLRASDTVTAEVRRNGVIIV